MSEIKSWSTTAASNNSTSPNGFPENMLPAGLNNSAREVMASVRAWYEEAQWVDMGYADIAQTGATTFTLTSASDLSTTTLEKGRRLKLNDSSVLYATITNSTHASTTQTITVVVDGGTALTSNLDRVWISAISALNTSFPSSLAAPNPSLIINGGMDRWQRGTSFTAATTPANNDDTYLADRWILQSDTNDIVDVSRESTVVASDSLYAMKSLVATANKKFGHLTILENIDTAKLRGHTLTVSFEARLTATTLSALRVGIVEWASTADAPTSDIVANGAWGAAGTDPTLATNWSYGNTPSNLTLSTSYQTFTATMDAAVASGTNNIGVFIWVDDTDCTVGDILYIDKVKLEKGSVATGWYPEKIANITEEAKRYYRYLGQGIGANNLLYVGGGVMTSATNARVHLQFPVSMRDVPTLDKSAVDALTVTDGTSTLVSTNITTVAAKDGAVLNVTVATGTFSATDSISVYLNASDYIGFNAEL